jgi:hypothetical protein
MEMTGTRFKATYQGVVIGWYDTMELADSAIDRAERLEREARDAEDIDPLER